MEHSTVAILSPYPSSREATIAVLRDLNSLEKHIGYKKSPTILAAIDRLKDVYQLKPEELIVL